MGCRVCKNILTTPFFCAMMWIITVEVHCAISSPDVRFALVVGRKGAGAEGRRGRAAALVLGNKIPRTVAFCGELS